jgi:DNA-binding XRE family transcriptional regulator
MLYNMSKTLGERMKEVREDVGLSQADFGKKIGVSRTTVHYWENGTIKNVRPIHLYKAARTGRCSAEWLGTGDGQKTTTGAVEDVLNELPLPEQLAVFDYIDYQIERSPTSIAGEKVARYTAMVKSLKSGNRKGDTK